VSVVQSIIAVQSVSRDLLE